MAKTKAVGKRSICGASGEPKVMIVMGFLKLSRSNQATLHFNNHLGLRRTKAMECQQLQSGKEKTILVPSKNGETLKSSNRIIDEYTHRDHMILIPILFAVEKRIVLFQYSDGNRILLIRNDSLPLNRSPAHRMFLLGRFGNLSI